MGFIKNYIKKKLNMYIDGRLNGRLEEIEERIRVHSELLEALQSDQKKICENLYNINVIVPDKTDALSRDIETLSVNVRNNNNIIEELQSGYDMLNIKVKSIRTKVENVNTNKAEVKIVKNIDDTVPNNQDYDYQSIDYFDFENHFRGSRESIKRNQSQYLKYYYDCKKVLDVGCGRGEFLELLKENSIGAVGVDLYVEYAEYCRQKGYNAIQGDAVKYLRETDETFDGIFVGQVVEHLSLEQLVQLCEACYDRLQKGSVVIMETPNPTSLAIYTHAFYIDPSHNKPVHPLTLQYLLQKAGFGDTEIIYTDISKLPVTIPQLDVGEQSVAFNNSMKEVERLLFGSQDYAIVARK